MVIVVASNKIVVIHNKTFHEEDKKYKCDVCGHRVSHKNSLARHKKIAHEGVKFPCWECNYQADGMEFQKVSKRKN